MTTTRIIYGTPVDLTDANAETVPVKGILNGLGPSKYFGYRLMPFDNSAGWEDLEICCTLRGIAKTDDRAVVNVYLYASCDNGNRWEPFDTATAALAPGLIRLTGNETLLGYVYLTGGTKVKKMFNLSTVQRFNRGFPPRNFGIIVANCSENDLNASGNSVTVRGMRHEEV